MNTMSPNPLAQVQADDRAPDLTQQSYRSEAEAALAPIAEQLRQKLAETSLNLIESGQLLLKAKSLLRHGKFRDWLSANFSMSIKTANRFMSVARMVQALDLDAQTVAQLMCMDMRVIYELAAKSTSVSVQREILSQLETGRPISYEQVRELKQYHLPGADGSSEDLLRFTRRLNQLSEGLVQQLPDLQSPALMRDESIRTELRSCARRLQEARLRIDELLATAEAIPVLTVAPIEVRSLADPQLIAD